MRAAVLHGASDLRIEDVADALPPHEGEVRLRIIAAGICGTDLHEYLHAPVFAPLATLNPASGHVGPMIIGHEFLGIVDSIGDGVEGFRVGDRVVAGAGQWCGACEYCRQGRTNLCDRYYTFGLNRDGGMADQVTVPAQMLIAVPDGLADIDAVLAQPVAVAAHAVRRSGASPGDRVAVLGAGAIGALVVAALNEIGVAPVVFDIDSGRLATATVLGAAEVVHLDPAAGDRDPGIATRGRSFGITFDTSGVPSSLNTAGGLVARGGVVMAIGLPGAPVSIDSHDFVVREVEIRSSSAHVCAVDLPAAVELLDHHAISSDIVAEVIDLEELVSAFHRLANREIAGKVIVRIAADHLREPAAGRKQ